MTIPTPVTDGLDFEHVYEPAEDSFLLLDALEHELEFIRDRLRPVFCLEIGSGSGIISVALASALQDSFVIACDLNPKACEATLKTAEVNNAVHKLGIVKLDFLQSFPLPNHKMDLVVCNPPYVATDEVETGQSDIYASWAGGHLGRSLTDRLIEKLPLILSEQGAAYIVVEQCNKPEEVRQRAEECSLNAEFILSRRAGREVLHVLKVNKKQL